MRRYPNHVGAIIGWADVALARCEYEKAINRYAHVMELNYESPWAYLNRGKAWEGLATKAVQSDPSKVKHFREQALNDFAYAARLNPGWPEARQAYVALSKLHTADAIAKSPANQGNRLAAFDRPQVPHLGFQLRGNESAVASISSKRSLTACSIEQALANVERSSLLVCSRWRR